MLIVNQEFVDKFPKNSSTESFLKEARISNYSNNLSAIITEIVKEMETDIFDDDSLTLDIVQHTVCNKVSNITSMYNDCIYLLFSDKIRLNEILSLENIGEGKTLGDTLQLMLNEYLVNEIMQQLYQYFN